MQRSKIPYFFLVLAAILAATALVMLVTQVGVKPPPSPAGDPSASTSAHAANPGDGTARQAPATRPAAPATGAADPAALVAQVAKALETGDFAKLARLVGKDALAGPTLDRLKALTSAPLHLRQPEGVRELGELELNVRSRWALELVDQASARHHLHLDLRRINGKWTVDKITLPSASADPTQKPVVNDSLGVADAFLQAVLRQDFEFARAFVDPKTVSDAKIAGLCILFEEGEYRLRKSKPLRAMFQRDDTVGYLAYVETKDNAQAAQFALTLRQAPSPANWIISEINLNQLLADYSRRVAGGDPYYTPFVKNPSGGDTLALYFDFDEDQMSSRTRRQLEIVSLILRSDPGKKITLSGHTDALGTKEYNNNLSSRRADVVRNFLSKAGVAPSQIVTVAKGDSQPRRPNLTESGEDNPEGRRANRRTEIYLDF